MLSTKLFHFGDPSFEQVLSVPLIIAPAFFANTAPLFRSEDVSDLIRQVAGIRDELILNDSMKLKKDELYLTEKGYQTYRKGRWKSFWPRNSSRIYLVDLEADPQEMYDEADDHPEIIETHRKRVKMLNQALSSSLGHEDQFSEEDLDRLRTLGYVE